MDQKLAEIIMDTTIRKFYAPQSQLKTIYLENNWAPSEISGNCEALIYLGSLGSSKEGARRFVEWINQNSQGIGKNIVMLNVPIDMVERVDWSFFKSRLRHLYLSRPVNDFLWEMYKDKRLPDFSSIRLDKLETLHLPCPLVNWKGFSTTAFPLLKWISIDLEAMDRSGRSIKLAFENRNIMGIDICDPKGADVLKHVKPDVLGISIWRETSRSFNFSELARFKQLKYLQLIGGATPIDIGEFCNLEDLEELDIASYPAIRNAEKILDFKKIRMLKIGGIDQKYLSADQKKDMASKIASCEFD